MMFYVTSSSVSSSEQFGGYTIYYTINTKIISFLGTHVIFLLPKIVLHIFLS